MNLATQGWFAGLQVTRIDVSIDFYTKDGLASEMKLCLEHGFWLRPLGSERSCPFCSKAS